MLRAAGQLLIIAAIASISQKAFAETGGPLVPDDPKTTHNKSTHDGTAQVPTTPAQKKQKTSAPLYNKAELEAWYRSDLPRGDKVTPGDFSLHIRPVSNRLPVELSEGFRTIICAGAGCPIKVPFTFANAHLERIKKDMAEARAKAHCTADTAKCEMVGLKVAVVTMEKMVHDEKLRRLSLAQQQAYSVKPENEIGKATVQDCVDQTTNGITYLYVLAQKGLMQHHSIIEPGASFNHHYTRIKSDQGQVYAFDLYHRGDYGIPPFVECENCH